MTGRDEELASRLERRRQISVDASVHRTLSRGGCGSCANVIYEDGWYTTRKVSGECPVVVIGKELGYGGTLQRVDAQEWTWRRQLEVGGAEVEAGSEAVFA
ncbi:unnamed protein product [Hydatigera taeniaeformis]|uniref:Pept_C1 domain-containing protein n=1 Tax=Hydatigena taeniaeformis TaxID=6205 RepID=A0A0R3X8V7_HYDTA|nr:unnamed protein product [Hydatigera taeniaeformis]